MAYSQKLNSRNEHKSRKNGDVFYQMCQNVNGTVILDHQQVVNTQKETLR